VKGDGSAAEAMAALALTQEGFDVALPVFRQPSFDMISKWGRVIHTIQVKTGCIQPNGKTVQWKTTKRQGAGLYEEGDCSFFGMVLIPHNAVWWIPFEEAAGKKSICTNIDNDLLFRYRGNLDSLKA